MSTKLAKKALVAIPPPPSRFTLDEWYTNNRLRYRCLDDQAQLADRLLAESGRLQDQVADLAKRNKNETNHSLDQRILDIEFRKNEIIKVRKLICMELEALDTYKERIMDTMQSVKKEALQICKKCIILREGRLGIDLVHDDVEKELQKEVEVINGAQAMLTRALEQSHEQVRRLRSTLYFVDRDLENKDNALKIDKHNVVLKEHHLNLSMYHGLLPLNSSNISEEEWDNVTKNIFSSASKELNSASMLRSYIDNIIKQAIDDLINQYNIVNEAFRRRIEETKDAKTKLELKHYEITRQVNEMSRNITNLEKAIADKEGYMALCHTRLGNRTHRPDVEMCRDLVETKLVYEIQELVVNVKTLQETLTDAQASLRYLLKTQIQLEEDLNVKTSTLKIDEVDCMTLRQSMNYHQF